MSIPSAPKTHLVQTTLGELISALYEAFLADLGDEELAAIATAHSLAELLGREDRDLSRSEAA